jgi:hypothetical protein
MRHLLGSEGALTSPLSSEERDVLLKGHIEATSDQSAMDLQALREGLQAVSSQADASTRVQTGDSVFRSLSSARPLSAVRAPSDERFVAELANCTVLDPPQFTIESPQQEDRPQGGVTRASRADASARTLEATAATGETGLGRWPSSETFGYFGFNQSEASIGGILTVPRHGAGATLIISAQLQVEHIFCPYPWDPDNCTYTREAASALAVTERNPDRTLPFGGSVGAYCLVGLHLYGAQGSIWTITYIIDKLSTISTPRIDGIVKDRASDGKIDLTTTVALTPPTSETSSLSVFVNVRCFAGLEESDGLPAGFAICEIRNKPIGECNGWCIPPSRLHLQEVTACLGQLRVFPRNGVSD